MNYKQNIGTTSENRKLLVILAILSVLAGFGSATQYLAYSLNYQKLLGFNLNGFYEPFAIIRWSFKWYSLMPDIFDKAHSVGLLIVTFGLFGVTITKFMLLNSAKANKHLHGSARFADKKDIEQAKLTLIPASSNALKKTGECVYVGGFKDNKGRVYYLQHSGNEHILTYAPTRSGKGVGLVIPTLLSWTSSCVIYDLKGELWELTAGWRKYYAKNKVLRFEPANSTNCARWNPLAEIRIGTDYEVGDVQNIATLIVDPDGKGLNDHWAKTSFALLVGVILHLKYQEKNGELFDDQGKPCETTMSMVDGFLADPLKVDKQESWKDMISYPHIRPNTNSSTWKTHPAVATAGKDMLDRPEKEAGSVLSVTKSFLSLYRDPVVSQNTATCDFRIKDLMHHDSPISLYIVSPPSDKGRLRPLIRLLISMIVRLLADKLEFKNGRPKATYKNRLLMLIDEFPSLGKLDIMQESLAFVAGYGIKCYLICQDLEQLRDPDKGYGQHESISSNCHIQNAYAPNKKETAQYLSDMTGQTTVIKEQITTSGRRASAMHSQVSRTLQETQRPLLTTDEILRIPKAKEKNDVITEAGDMLIFVAGVPVIYGKQILYFQDNYFNECSKIKAPKTSDFVKSNY